MRFEQNCVTIHHGKIIKTRMADSGDHRRNAGCRLFDVMAQPTSRWMAIGDRAGARLCGTVLG
jgi:hypothetical protein